MKHKQNNGNGLMISNKGFRAVVVSIMNKQCQVLSAGELIGCIVPGALISGKNSLAVGDEVEVGLASPDQYKLLGILPRKSALYRGDRRTLGEEILIAANAEHLLAIVTADYTINQAGFLEAAIIAAQRAGISVSVFVSKCDLIGENAKATVAEKLDLYRNVTDLVLYGASHEANEELVQAVKGKTTAVVGDRSSGKTTLINSVVKRLGAEGTCKGAAASTHMTMLYAGAHNTRLIDTPGFRSFSLAGITQQERDAVFVEIARLAEQCRFGSCTHVYEDDCQVVEGLRTGQLRRERYDAYQKMAGNIPMATEGKKGAPKVDYRHFACEESYVCKACGMLVIPDGAGSRHRNHCPHCLCSVHVDIKPGDRAALCRGVMDPVSVWVRKGGEWAIIHRCRLCGALSSNRVAADDNPMLLMSIAVKPLSAPPFPLDKLASL